ncbi:hypothetical protein BGZ63DRAFT_383970 [Mariannaea sp. PMI_226]|nr:hypothetical protein BGZ63DRAFT_383970 [Mariannaea sp. PMI_226]
MTVAHICRACAKAQSAVSPALLALRQNYRWVGTVTTKQYSTASQSQLGDNRSQIISQFDLKHLSATNASSPSQDSGPAAPPRRINDLFAVEVPPKDAEPSDIKRETKKSKKHAFASTKDSKRPSKPVAQRRPKATIQAARASKVRPWLITPEQKADYQQWGYIRHQYQGDELLAVRRQFNAWKRKLHLVMERRNTIHRPWQDDGKWLFELKDTASMRKAWEEMDLKAREQQWFHVMLSTLHSCPHKAGQVLAATLDPLPPGYAIADTILCYLKSINVDEVKSPQVRASIADEIVDLIAKVLLDLPSNYVPLRQYTLALLAGKLPTDQVAEIYQTLRQTGLKLHWHTRLRYASTLAKSLSHKDSAYEILRSLCADKIDFNQPIIASVVTTLLHVRDTDSTSSNSFSPQRAMEFFLENGYAPNLASFTALVDSLCKQGDLAEAIRLPLLLAENGADLDTRCYEIVFRGAKHSLKASNIRQALDVAKAAKVPYVDVLNNILHSVFYFAEMECREKRQQPIRTLPVFTPLLSVYSKRFDLEPLQWLLPDTLPLILEQSGQDGLGKFRSGPPEEWNFSHTILPIAEEFFDSGPVSRQEPNSVTLAIMLRAYIKSLQNPYDIMTFWSFFKTRLEETDVEKNWAIDLVKKEGSIIHDTLILTMLEHRSLLRPALQVFGDMLRDSLKTKLNEDERNELPSSSEDTAVHPVPNLFTFNIMIHGLFMRHEKLLAEQVLQVLREHKLEPNNVTWNTLVKGYASMQKLSQTVGTLQDLEAAGFKPDSYTFRAFARLNDQTRALQMMEKIIDTNMKQLEKDHSW